MKYLAKVLVLWLLIATIDCQGGNTGTGSRGEPGPKGPGSKGDCHGEGCTGGVKKIIQRSIRDILIEKRYAMKEHHDEIQPIVP